MKIIINILVVFCFLFGMDYGIKTIKTYASQKPIQSKFGIMSGETKNISTKGENTDLSDLGWRVPVAMIDNAKPFEMQLYLTKDLRMIWVRNDHADYLGRIQRHPIISKNDFLNYELGLVKPYTDFITYANVDFKNIKQKQSKTILLIINEEFAHTTFFTLGKTYHEIMNDKPSKDIIRDFTIDDVEVFKKEENMCISFDGKVINPHYNLQKTIASLKRKGFSNEADTKFLKNKLTKD